MIRCIGPAEFQARAKTLRHDLFKHLSIRASVYKQWFEPDQKTVVEMEAGSVPKSWEEFLEAGPRDQRLIDGLSLMAAAKRYGIHIIVVPFGYSNAQPVGFGSPKAAKDPVVLLLRSGHVTLGRRKEEGQCCSCAFPLAPQASLLRLGV